MNIYGQIIEFCYVPATIHLRLKSSKYLTTFSLSPKIIVVSTGCAVVIFHSYKPTGSTNQPEVQKIRFIELATTLAGKRERESSYNKRLSQQPALEALTFLQSFVAGKANFCSHLLASLVHFTVVKSQAILIIRLGVAEIIYHSSWGRRSYFRRNFISSSCFKTTTFLPRWICSGTTILRVDSAYRFDSNDRCVGIM